MRKSGLVILPAFILLTVISCKQGGEDTSGVGVVVADMDTTVVPGNDFYQYACGGWISANPIPGDEVRWGTFPELGQRNKENLHKLIEEASAGANAKSGSPEQMVGDFYHSAMDTVTIEKLGASPIKADMDAIDQLSDNAQLLGYVASMHAKGEGVMFDFYAYQDPKNSEVVVPQVYQGGLSLPDRDYYLKNDDRYKNIRQEYLKYITNMFKLYGVDEATATKHAANIMRLETDLAKASMTRVETRDPNKTYNKVTIADLNKMTPSINWGTMLSNLGAKGGYDYLVLGQPLFMAELEKQLKTTSLDDWKTYLKWHTLSGSASLLSDAFVKESFHFNSQVMRGQKEMKLRWKRMTEMTDMMLGDALGQMYAAKYFPPDAKKKADEMVTNLMLVYRERLGRLDWMSAETKKKAQEKLDAIIRKIGYPDKWKTYDGLTVKKDAFYENVLAASRWEYNYMMNKIGKPVDKGEWFMSAPTVNAYYNPSVNEIVFPAGILQPPFFNAQADDAVNYGAIGAVIGHELTHGFDDQGRNFDAKGNLTNWWTSEDSAKFEAKAKVLVEQYNSFIVLDSLHVNGELTLGENIADLGGLTIAYEAFKRTDQGKGDKKIDGFTPDQRFFLGFSRIWAGSVTQEEQAQRLITDAHSPANYRVNGTLSNIPEFYSTFNVKQGDKLYRAETDRAKIW